MREPRERFADLFAVAYGPLWAYASRRVDQADVDDVVSETLAVAWRRLDAVPTGDGALPWLYGVCRRTIANHRRSVRRRRRLLARLATEPRHSGSTTSDGAVLEALAGLRPADQEVLRLAAWEGLGPAQIAVALGCSPNAAAVRLSRARSRLRERMKGSDRSRTGTLRKGTDA